MNPALTAAAVQGTSGEVGGLRDVFGLLLDEWRTIAGVTTASMLLAALYAAIATPIYRTDALLQVEERDSGLGIQEFSWLSTGRTPTDAEIEILRSRMVLTQAIEQQALTLVVAPVHFPVVGAAFARFNAAELASAPFGLDEYAWGGERLQVDRFDVEPPLYGAEFTLIAGRDGRYLLRDADGREVLRGTVGQSAEAPGLALFVTELHARPGTRFTIMRSDALATFDELRGRLSVGERGLQTGILELSLDGTDPARTASVLDAITNVYLRQNVERRSVEAARSLEFLNAQLPDLRAQVEAAEQALNRFRVEKGSVDLSLETQGVLEQLTEVERRLSELELERVERSQLFTPQHPAMVALEEQQRELEQTRANFTTQIRALPAAEQDALRLTRDSRVSNELYTLLLNRVQELRVVQAGTVGNVRIIDSAFVPRDPVRPRKALVLALGFILGGMLGIGVVFLRQMFDDTLRDPKLLEQHFGLPVYAIVPRSPTETRESATPSAGGSLLAVSDPHDPAVESLRSLRTSLEFLFQEAPNRILAIGGAAPDVGKSFVAANTSVLLAQTGQKVLIIDADLRRGRLHTRFGVEREPGLTDLIAKRMPIENALRQVQDTLFLLPTGALPKNPAEVLHSPEFVILLAELSKRYRAVVLDLPPVLAASEAANLARLAGLNVLVVRSGRQNRREVELALDRLAHAGARACGFVFNDLVTGSRRYAYAGYRAYRYEPQPGR